MTQINTLNNSLIINGREFNMDDPEALRILSEIWLRCGWDTKYVYSFTWMGRPMIQLPEDMMRIQEVIFQIKPDVIIETGIAHGGSLLFYASLCKSMNKGRVIGIDIEIRKHNRKAIEEHFLFPFIKLVEGDSIAPQIIKSVSQMIHPGEKVFIILDSNHTKNHVLGELNGYSHLVTVGSYLVACDGIMEHVAGASRTQPDWIENNPKKAAEKFVEENKNFILCEPEFLFNEGKVDFRITYWPAAFIKKIK